MLFVGKAASWFRLGGRSWAEDHVGVRFAGECQEGVRVAGESMLGKAGGRVPPGAALNAGEGPLPGALVPAVLLFWTDLSAISLLLDPVNMMRVWMYGYLVVEEAVEGLDGEEMEAGML